MAGYELEQFVGFLVDLLRVVTHSSTAFVLGAALILMLALRWFPGFAELARSVLAHQIRNARFRKGSACHDRAIELANWLDRSESIRHSQGDDSTHDRRSANKPNHHRPDYFTGLTIGSRTQEYCLQEQLAVNNSYATFACQSGPKKYVCKLSFNNIGDRLLIKETGVIDYLREQSVGSIYGQYLPQQADSFRIHGRNVNSYVSAESNCFSATQIKNRFPDGLPGEHVAWMFNRTLEALGFIHRQGTVHAAILPQHLLFDTRTHALRIVDWTHAKRIGKPLHCIPRRYRDWYPLEATQRRPVVPATDIFMAARVAQYLAGGNSPNDQPAHLPAHFPAPIGRFLQACLFESPNMRPDDAWELHEEFSDLLEGLYGPPRFCHLVMN